MLKNSFFSLFIILYYAKIFSAKKTIYIGGSVQFSDHYCKFKNMEINYQCPLIIDFTDGETDLFLSTNITNQILPSNFVLFYIKSNINKLVINDLYINRNSWNQSFIYIYTLQSYVNYFQFNNSRIDLNNFQNDTQVTIKYGSFISIQNIRQNF